MTTPKKGVLIVNLGSPKSPSPQDIHKFLAEFLMDGRVLDTPWLLRFCVVHFAILPSRPILSSEAYKKIWTPEGSPQIVESKKLQKRLAESLKLPLQLAMRYQNPSIPDAIASLKQQGVNDLLLIPLFPHYAMCSYETVAERVKDVAGKLAPEMKVTVESPYYNNPEYIQALVASAQPYLKTNYDLLLFSFHGIPERHIQKSDLTGCHCLKTPDCCDADNPAHSHCYRAQCLKTVQMFVTAAGIPSNKFSVSFQSRLGRQTWLTPYTDLELARFGRSGLKNLLVLCPSFTADCLETLEEIGIRGKETFLQAGGSNLTLIPCLNDHPLWVNTLKTMICNWAGKESVL